MDVTALGSVYGRECPARLRQALESLLGQTRQARQVVLVIDGPVGADLEAVIGEFTSRLPLVTVRQPVNVGLGRALNAGLPFCTGDLIARFDTDDINAPNRFETQVQLFERCPRLDICSSAVAEFTEVDGLRHVTAIRTVPSTHEKIVRYAWLRNPFNHPAVMFRTSCVARWGGYVDHLYFEDFLTWVNWIHHGAYAANLDSPLVMMRAGSAQMARRGGLRYLRSEMAAARRMFAASQISLFQLFCFAVLRAPARLAPRTLRQSIYQLIRSLERSRSTRATSPDRT